MTLYNAVNGTEETTNGNNPQWEIKPTLQFVLKYIASKWNISQ